MSQRALDLAIGEAQYFSPPVDPTEELTTGMLKLRLSNNVRSTFPLFSSDAVGTMARSFFGLVSSSPTDPDPEVSSLFYRAPQSTRFLYELAFHTRNASRVKSPGAVRIVKEAMTSQLWRRFPSEIVSLATAGIPSSYDVNLEEPLFVRLLKEDESTTLDFPPAQPIFQDPLATLTHDELHYLLTVWFTCSPYCLFLNDALTLAAITTNTHDRALISILVGIAISMENFNTSATALDSPALGPVAAASTGTAFLAGGLPPSVPGITGKIISRKLDHKPFIEYGQQLLSARPVEEAARSIESVQALLILGAFVGSEHKTRESWAIMSSGYAIARESLKRLQEMGERERLKRTERQAVDDESLIGVVWMLAIFGSWSFLSLNLPRSTLIDVTDSLPLPPFTHHESRSFTYRSSAKMKVSECEAALKMGIQGFNETCRTLALVVTLSVKNPQYATGFNARLPSEHHRFEYPIFADAGLANFGVSNVMVAKWLVQTAEEHAAPEHAARRRAATPSSGRAAVPSVFLSCVHAIMALHKLAPFDQPSESVVLSAAGLRLSIRAIELLISGSREKVVESMREGNGRVLPDSAKTGLLRLLGDALPHCLRLLDHLADNAKTSTEIFAIVFEEQVRIAKVLEDLISLTDAGITNSGDDSSLGARRVQYSLEKVHASGSHSTSQPISSPEDYDSAPLKVRVPPPPMAPSANRHYRSLSSDSFTFSPYPQPNRNRSGSWSSLSVASNGGRSRSGSSSSLVSSVQPPVQRLGRGRSDSGFESLTIPSPSSYIFTPTSSISEVATANLETSTTSRTSFDSPGMGTDESLLANSWPSNISFIAPEWTGGDEYQMNGAGQVYPPHAFTLAGDQGAFQM